MKNKASIILQFVVTFVVISAGILFLLIISAPGVVLFLPGLLLPIIEISRSIEAASYISKIDEFKNQNGYYPPTDRQKIVHDDNFVYKTDGMQYCIGYAVGFDLDYRYCSATKKWHEADSCEICGM
jgi:hypothetical protein